MALTTVPIFCVGAAVGSVFTVSIISNNPDDIHKLKCKNARLCKEVTDSRIALDRRNRIIRSLKEREHQLGEDDPGDWWKDEKPNPLGDCS